MEPIQVEFTYTAEFFNKSQRQILWHYYTKGWLKWVFLLVAVCWIIKLVIDFNFWYTSLMLVFVVGLWWLIFNWLSKRNFSKLATLQHPIRYVFREEDVTLNTQTSETVLQWAAFQYASEARDFFLLHQNRMAANPVMKSGFQSESEMERFRALLRRKGLMK